MIAKEEQVNLVRIESNFGDGMFNSLFAPVLARIHKCTLEEYRVTGQKEARIIDKLEPPMNSHRVVMDKTLIEQQFNSVPSDAGERARYYNGFYQMAYLTRDRGSLKQDDRIDVLAEAVGYFTEMVARDVERAADRTAAKHHERSLKDFVDNAKAGYRRSVVGGQPKKRRGSFTARR